MTLAAKRSDLNYAGSPARELLELLGHASAPRKALAAERSVEASEAPLWPGV